MPRTVRISPVPIPPPPVTPPPTRRYGGLVGVALLLAAVVLGLGHVLLAGKGSHSYDRHASPPARVHLTAGKTYLISTDDGPGVTQSASPLTCTYTEGDGTPRGLAVTAEAGDSRATHAVAKFVGPATGQVAVACTGGAVGSRPVFVDDADDAGADLAGILLVLAVLAAVPGVGLVLGALYRRFGAPAGGDAPDDRVSGVTAEQVT